MEFPVQSCGEIYVQEGNFDYIPDLGPEIMLGDDADQNYSKWKIWKSTEDPICRADIKSTIVLQGIYETCTSLSDGHCPFHMKTY